jgi:hypothetical protein
VVVGDDIGHFGGGIEFDSEFGQVVGVQMEEFGFSIADISNGRAGGEAWAKLFNYSFNQRIMASSRKSQRFTIRQCHGDAG